MIYIGVVHAVIGVGLLVDVMNAICLFTNCCVCDYCIYIYFDFYNLQVCSGGKGNVDAFTRFLAIGIICRLLLDCRISMRARALLGVFFIYSI